MTDRLRSVALLMALLGAALALACGSDDPVGTRDGCLSCQVVKNLSHKTDVLNNIEYAYNHRRGDVYDALLDDSFIFYFGSGGTQVQWGRNVESSATAGLLGDASKIDVDITWEDGVSWIETPAGTENWFATTVFYHFTIKIGDTTYIPNAGSKAQFTVRNNGTAEMPHWKLVEFRDLGGPSIMSALERVSTEVTSWGKVKALYR